MLITLVLAGPPTVSQLPDRLGIDRTTLTRNVALGEQQKLVWCRRARIGASTCRDHADRAAGGGSRVPAWRQAQAGEMQAS